MSHQAIFLNQADRAVDLAQAARITAQRAHLPALVAEASVMKAHAHALLGQSSECVAALNHAEGLLERTDRVGDPHWMGYFDEAYLAAIAGHCFRALGQAVEAETWARRSLDMSPGYVRGRLFNQILLAGSLVLKTDIDQACAVAHQALDLAEEVSSARVVTFVGRLVNDLGPWRKERRVKEFHERAALVTT